MIVSRLSLDVAYFIIINESSQAVAVSLDLSCS